MNKDKILQLKEELSAHKNIVIIPHKNPDGDAVGSVTALYGYLIQLGHQVNMVSPNDFPLFLIASSLLIMNKINR